jgi:hypothetical protein
LCSDSRGADGIDHYSIRNVGGDGTLSNVVRIIIGVSSAASITTRGGKVELVPNAVLATDEIVGEQRTDPSTN